MTDFLEDHPGGGESITISAGQDSSEEFNALHSDKARAMLEDYYIGDLDSSVAKPPVSDELLHVDIYIKREIYTIIMLCGRVTSTYNIYKERDIHYHNALRWSRRSWIERLKEAHPPIEPVTRRVLSGLIVLARVLVQRHKTCLLLVEEERKEL